MAYILVFVSCVVGELPNCQIPRKWWQSPHRCFRELHGVDLRYWQSFHAHCYQLLSGKSGHCRPSWLVVIFVFFSLQISVHSLHSANLQFCHSFFNSSRHLLCLPKCRPFCAIRSWNLAIWSGPMPCLRVHSSHDPEQLRRHSGPFLQFSFFLETHLAKSGSSKIVKKLKKEKLIKSILLKKFFFLKIGKIY